MVNAIKLPNRPSELIKHRNLVMSYDSDLSREPSSPCHQVTFGWGFICSDICCQAGVLVCRSKWSRGSDGPGPAPAAIPSASHSMNDSGSTNLWFCDYTQGSNSSGLFPPVEWLNLLRVLWLFSICLLESGQRKLSKYLSEFWEAW